MKAIGSPKTKQKYFLSLLKELFIQAKLTEEIFYIFFRFGKRTAIKVLWVYFS